MSRNNKKRKLKEDFKSKDKVWRIEAVIHDGNWYDKKKWARVAKVKKEDINDWIKSNEDILIKSDKCSYRVNYDEIIRWYSQKNIDLEKSIIPHNFPPKLWGETTETDVFLNAPRRRVGTVSFEAEDLEMLNKCINILRGTAKVISDKGGRHKAHGLSAVHIKNLLSKGLSEKEFNSLNIKTRAVLMQRELIDFPLEWLENALSFYIETFAPNALANSMSTISIYLPNREDVGSQTTVWVIQAIKKFNENASVPFAGYLSSVLGHWPYNLPDEHLGKELSRFQRERKKAIDLAISKGYKNDNVPIDVLSKIMDMPISEYINLTNEHETWLSEKNATTLTWGDSANEKKGKHLGKKKTLKSDKHKMFNLSLATIKAAVDTKEWDSAYNIISEIDQNDIDNDIHSKLDKEYLKSLSEHLKEIDKR